MAKSFDELTKEPPHLKPVAVEIGGLDEEIYLHQFTWDEFQNFTVESENDDESSEKAIQRQVVKFLKGAGCEPSDDDCAALGKVFSVAQIREIYRKGMRLNGLGIDALKDAEKK